MHVGETQNLCGFFEHGISHYNDDLVKDFSLHIPNSNDVQVGSQIHLLNWDLKFQVKNDDLNDKFKNASSLELSKILPLFGIKCWHEDEVDSFENSEPLGFYRVVFEPGLDGFANMHLLESRFMCFQNKHEPSIHSNKTYSNLFLFVGMKDLNSRTNSLEEEGNDGVQRRGLLEDTTIEIEGNMASSRLGRFKRQSKEELAKSKLRKAPG